MNEQMCARCGDELPRIDVTTWGDLPQRRYVYGLCDCPMPSCVFCHRAIDGAGRCVNLGCFFAGNLVPVPEWV